MLFHCFLTKTNDKCGCIVSKRRKPGSPEALRLAGPRRALRWLL